MIPLLFRCFLALCACISIARADLIELEQADGSNLSLQGPAKRLVTLSPHLAELVFTAGAGDLLLGTVAYSDYPAAAADIPRIGDAFRLDAESILARRPDLVIAWDSGNPQAAVDQLRSLGLTVWSVEIREPEEIADILEAIGSATGRPEPARSHGRIIRERLARLARQYQQASQMEYFYQVGVKPLFTINGEHLISKGLTLCGGRNVFEDENGLAFQVGYEAVIVANPDALFAPRPEGAPDPLAAWRDWPAMRAVQRDALFLLPADPVSRATPRFLDSLEFACTLLDGLRGQNRDE